LTLATIASWLLLTYLPPLHIIIDDIIFILLLITLLQTLLNITIIDIDYAIITIETLHYCISQPDYAINIDIIISWHYIIILLEILLISHWYLLLILLYYWLLIIIIDATLLSLIIIDY
jgi:hypothetical protein